MSRNYLIYQLNIKNNTIVRIYEYNAVIHFCLFPFLKIVYLLLLLLLASNVTMTAQ